MLIASKLSEVLPLIGVVIGGVIAISGQFVLAWMGRVQRRHAAARLFHAELAGLYLVLDAEGVTEKTQTRYGDVRSTWREHRDALSTVDETTWAALWITMQTLDTLFSMGEGPARQAYRTPALSTISDGATTIASYSGRSWMRRLLRRLKLSK